MESLVAQASRIRTRFSDKQLVFVSGNFNIIHPGHLRLINFAKSCGEVLVIGLFSDLSPDVVVAMEDRKASLMSLEAVDEVVALDHTDLVNFISSLRPELIIKGKEHERSDNAELESLKAYGGRLIFGAGESTFSSRDLIRKELASASLPALSSDRFFLQRRGSGEIALRERLASFSGMRVCVIGDLILDEYIYCDPLGMSQEDPTIVVTPVERKIFLGGAGIVASHLAGLGASTKFFSVVGADEMASRAKDLLEQYRVAHFVVTDSSRPTIVKQRYRVGTTTLLRVSHLRSHDLERDLQIDLLHSLSSTLRDFEGLVFSDFNYGCLPQELVDEIFRLCRALGVRVFADSQASSQVGDVSRFRGADFISATEREARLAMNDPRSGLQHVANSLLLKADTRHLLLKLGAEGLLVLAREPRHTTDELPAFNSNPVDVAGAGDALLATAALTRLAGGTIWEAAYLGALAAGIQVSRMGNVPIDLAALARELASPR